MTITMKHNINIAQMKDCINGLLNVAITPVNKDEVYPWIEDVLNQIRYYKLTRSDKGIVREYLMKMTAYSESQITRLITKKIKTGKVLRTKRTQPRFETKYTRADIEMLAEVDNLYDRPSGPALRSVLQDEYRLYKEKDYARLKDISSSHIYNLRNTPRYKENSLVVAKTKTVSTPIGERRKPDPEGQPGFIRVDTVHQGDFEGVKGVYHINLVDEVTQWEIVICVEKISEEYLKPALRIAIKSFPFVILNFHSDNGGEYINKTVAKLLKKLLINQTKSRTRTCNDNALVEGKNAAIIRKAMGHAHIPQCHADLINQFYQSIFNDHTNFHRKCGFSTDRELGSGKIKKIYKHSDYRTPYQKFKSLSGWQRYLRSNITKKLLEEKAYALSHIESARILKEQKANLFAKMRREKKLN